MHPTVTLFFAATAMSCAIEPTTSSADIAPIVVASATSPAIVSTHHALALDVSTVPISRGGVLSVPGEAMAATEGSRELLSLLVACALPASVTLTSAAPNADLEFFGEVGLAPSWTWRRLDARERRWVSACVFARLSGPGVAQAISLRGPRPGLRPTARSERDAWPVEEGGFYGDLFVPDGISVDWVACRGRGRDAGGLLDRTCALEDPDRPGQTLCGFGFAGDCEDACARRPNGYRRCRRPEGGVSEEVVTAFVMP